MKKYIVTISDYTGKSEKRTIHAIEGKSVADVRKKILKKINKKGVDFTVYDPNEYTTDPYNVKHNGKWMTLGVKKGECHIYNNGIFWYTYNEKTKAAKKYKLNNDGSINGIRKW